jgi:hypothetical protein
MNSHNEVNSSDCNNSHDEVNSSDGDLGRMANLKLVDKQVKELVKLKLQVLVEVRTSSG